MKVIALYEFQQAEAEVKVQWIILNLVQIYLHILKIVHLQNNLKLHRKRKKDKDNSIFQFAVFLKIKISNKYLICK
jgi:hypothetical protein